MIEHIHIFPTLITVIPNVLSTTECEELEKKFREMDTHPHGALTDGGSTHKDRKLFQNFQWVGERVQGLVGKVSHRHRYPEQVIRDSWMNIQKKNSALLEHTHPTSIMSGALYINVDENSSPLKFHNPNSFVSHQDVVGFDEHNFWWWEQEVSRGTLVMFPSWLKHSSDNNPNDTTERVVISFNTMNIEE